MVGRTGFYSDLDERGHNLGWKRRSLKQSIKEEVEHFFLFRDFLQVWIPEKNDVAGDERPKTWQGLKEMRPFLMIFANRQDASIFANQQGKSSEDVMDNVMI